MFLIAHQMGSLLFRQLPAWAFISLDLWWSLPGPLLCCVTFQWHDFCDCANPMVLRIKVFQHEPEIAYFSLIFLKIVN